MGHARGVFVLVASTGLVAWLGIGCTRDTPGFCCSTLDSCSGTGASSVVTCDPVGSRPFCDDLGEHGAAHTCIPDPASTGCTSSLECTTPARPVCDLDDTRTCIGCTTALDCTTRFPEQPLCDPTSRACVECVENSDCLAVDAPICAGDGTCQGCSADAQCASGVCDEDGGACVLEADLIHVNRATGAGTACTLADPCATITAGVAAITATRKYMLIAPGEYMESVVLDGRDVTMIGPGAGVQALINQPAILVHNDSTVRIEGMRLHDNGGGVNADGLRCAAPIGGTPSVTLIGTRIEGNVGFGIDANACAIRIDRGEIVNNPGGGISVLMGSFDIVNTFVTGNGGAISQFGGVKLDGNAATSRFEFNTVAGNLAGPGLAQALICSSVQTQRIANNIFWGASADQVAPTNCETEFNLSNEGLAGQGNVTGSPTFVSSTDYHLAAGSEGIDDADPQGGVPFDFDGDLRPQGGRKDIGADEVTP